MKNYRDTPKTTKDTEDVESNRLLCGSAAMQGWRIRQEDAHFCLPNFDKNVALFGLFDGHGGVEVARYAAETLPDLIKNSDAYQRSNYAGALRGAFREFDESLLKLPAQLRMEKLRADGNEEENLVELRDINEPPAFSSGCTAVVAMLVGNRLYVANIGDSRCIIGEGKKSIFPMTADHTPQKLKESLRIKKAGGFVSFGGRVNSYINLSRAFGDFLYKSNKSLPADEQMLISVPDIRVKLLHPERGDFFVLVCDGIWNAYSNFSIFDYMCNRINNPNLALSEIGSSLCDLCQSPSLPYAREGLDNMTCIIVKFKKDCPEPEENTQKPDETGFEDLKDDDEDEDDDTSSLVQALKFVNAY